MTGNLTLIERIRQVEMAVIGTRAKIAELSKPIPEPLMAHNLTTNPDDFFDIKTQWAEAEQNRINSIQKYEVLLAAQETLLVSLTTDFDSVKNSAQNKKQQALAIADRMQRRWEELRTDAIELYKLGTELTEIYKPLEKASFDRKVSIDPVLFRKMDVINGNQITIGLSVDYSVNDRLK